MRELKLFWHGSIVGTVQCPDSYRPPITQAELDRIPAMLIVRSRSFLFDVRHGDVRLELRGDGPAEEVVIVANDRLGPGDIGCIVGFRPSDPDGPFAPSTEMDEIVASVLASMRSQA